MGLLGSIAAGVADKVGTAAMQLGEKQIATLIEEERAKRLEEHRVATQEAATIRAEGRGIENRKLERGIIHDETVARSGDLRDIKVADQRALNIENTRAEIERFEKLAPLKRADAIATVTESLKAQATPDMLAAARKIAQAKHIVDPSYSLVQDADGTMLTVDSKTGKVGGVLKNPDTGEPVVKKSDEQLKAATAAVNVLNAEALRLQRDLKTAEDHYKAQKPSDVTTSPEAKKKADDEWKAAQAEYRAAIAALAPRRALAEAIIFDKTGPKKPAGPEQLAGPRDDAPGLLGTPKPGPAAPSATIEYVRDASGKLVPKQK